MKHYLVPFSQAPKQIATRQQKIRSFKNGEEIKE